MASRALEIGMKRNEGGRLEKDEKEKFKVEE